MPKERVINMSYPAFLDVVGKQAAFDDLLCATIVERGALHAALSKDSVTIRVETQVESKLPLRLAGRWRGPDFTESDFQNVESRIYLPLLFKITSIRLPHDQILSTSYNYRSISTLLMRCLFLAICCGQPVVCQTRVGDEADVQGITAMQRCYYYVLKSILREPAFDSHATDDAIHLMATNAYLPVWTPNSALLRHGAEQLRDSHRHRAQNLSTDMAHHKLLEARQQMLTHFRS